jgi:hypothetical protein
LTNIDSNSYENENGFNRNKDLHYQSRGLSHERMVGACSGSSSFDCTDDRADPVTGMGHDSEKLAMVYSQLNHFKRFVVIDISLAFLNLRWIYWF